jgi:hypothetical protein
LGEGWSSDYRLNLLLAHSFLEGKNVNLKIVLPIRAVKISIFPRGNEFRVTSFFSYDVSSSRGFTKRVWFEDPSNSQASVVVFSKH